MQRNRQRGTGKGGEEGWILSCFRTKGVKRLPHERVSSMLRVRLEAWIIGAPFNRLSVPHLSKNVFVRAIGMVGGDGCFVSKWF